MFRSNQFLGGCLRDLHFIKTGKRAKDLNHELRLQVTGTEWPTPYF